MTLTRRVATLAALSLATAGLGAVAAQPASAADGSTFTWSFSDYIGGQVPGIGFTHTASDGATTSGADVVFGGGTGTGSLATGDLHIAYTGTATYSWHSSVIFSDPEVIVEGDEGRIVADIGWDEGSGIDSSTR